MRLTRFTLALLACFAKGYAGYLALTPCEQEMALSHLGRTIRLAQERLNLADLALFTCPRPVVSLSPNRLPFPRGAVQNEETFKDFQRVEALGYAYAFLEKRRYAQKSLQFLESWLVKYNLIEQDIRPEDVYAMMDLLKGYSLVREEFDCRFRGRIDRWLRDVASSVLRTPIACQSPSARAKRFAFCGCVGYLTDLPDLCEQAAEGYSELLATVPIPHRFDCREELMEETEFIEALLQLAVAADRNGCDLYRSTSCIKGGLELRWTRLLPYFAGRQAPFFPGRKLATRLLQLAAYFDADALTAPVWGNQWETLDGYLNSLHLLCNPP